ncbi:hypothetical protein SAMN06295912_12254 [Sphingomonas laterariae]|uniref:Uncharacterized protein n=1 Tax=Edaphosphingomonas laterariae TaxID=861865 RepID=A0A239I961_9SPHN|nr:hypothetical protein [Sphingomonas laterariae]SNS89932.1 hypothetical protein SAMN06295912_12254 [Sphingomonas laterariae]
MPYILEWQSEPDRDPLCLVRHVRVFRRAGSLKTFVASRAFARVQVRELRLQRRFAGAAPEMVFTSPAAIAAWDPTQSGLPAPLADARWAERLAAMGVRAHLVERIAADLADAGRLELLSGAQIGSLLAQLKAMLAETAAASPHR